MRAAAVAAGGKKKGFVLSLVVDVLLRLTINQPTHTQRRESFCCCCLVEELNNLKLRGGTSTNKGPLPSPSSSSHLFAIHAGGGRFCSV